MPNEELLARDRSAPDRDPRARPGVPMIPDRVAPVAPAVTPQSPTVPVLVSVDVGQLTPIFSSAVPPRGLSGLMRRRAYAIPEHQARRWMLLLLSDRVDVWESRLRRYPLLSTSLGLGGLVLLALAATRPSKRRWRF
jgi:hypothetical protein